MATILDHNIGQKFHKSAARITLSMTFENLRRDARVSGFGWAKRVSVGVDGMVEKSET